MFIVRSVMQPLLFVFVFTYVFPKIGTGRRRRGPAETTFSSLLVPGVVAIACIFQGVQAVALPLVQEFGFTREIEDRVMAPLPVCGRGGPEDRVGRVCRGCSRRPSCSRWRRSSPPRRCTSTSQWLLLLTLLPLAALLGAALGLVHGHAGANPAGAAHVQRRGHPDDVPRCDLLPVGAAARHPVAAGGWCCSTRSST